MKLNYTIWLFHWRHYLAHGWYSYWFRCYLRSQT